MSKLCRHLDACHNISTSLWILHGYYGRFGRTYEKIISKMESADNCRPLPITVSSGLVLVTPYLIGLQWQLGAESVYFNQ